MRKCFIILSLLFCCSIGDAQIKGVAKGLLRSQKQGVQNIRPIGNVGNVRRIGAGSIRGLNTTATGIMATAGKDLAQTQQIQQEVDATLQRSHEMLEQTQGVIKAQGKTRRSRKTSEEWLKEYYEHPEELRRGTTMHQAFANIVKKVKTGEKTDAASLEIARIWQENTKSIAPKKTPEEWLKEYYEHPEELRDGTPLYKKFSSIANDVKEGKRTDEASLEISHIYFERPDRIAIRKTSEEWLREYLANPEELGNGTTPLHQAFKRIHERVKRGEKTDEASLEISRIYLENTQRKAVPKTSEEWLKEYYEHPEELSDRNSPLYKKFTSITHDVKKGTRTDEFSLEISRIYLERPNRIAIRKTSEEWLKEYLEHPEELRNGTPLHKAFRKIHEKVQRGEKTDEASLEISRIFLERPKLKDPRQTSERWLKEYLARPEEFKKGTPVYSAFYYISKQVKTGLRTDEASLEISRIYLENTKRIAAPKTTQEVYDLFLTYLRNNRTYPTRNDFEYNMVYDRLHRRELAEIKADPDLYKLYRLDQLARAARRGEKPWEVFDRDNPLKRTRINETSTPTEENLLQLQEDYAQETPDVQEILRQTEEYYEELWEHYPDWFTENELYIVPTPQTQRAFRVINLDVQAGRWSDETLDILDALNKMNLGPDGYGSYNRVIYRGNPSFTPRAGDFHLVVEEQGLQVPPLGELFPQHIPHISFAFGEGSVSTMILEEGVTSKDVETVIDTFLEHYQTKQEGWTIRMGKHETGSRPHIHFEFVDAGTEGGMDISYVLQLDVRKVIPESPQARQRLFSQLFGKYMN